MSWETTIARRIFRKDQPFMARRKLRYAIWACIVGLLAAGVVALLTIAVNSQRR
jgi:hypothetical protein